MQGQEPHGIRLLIEPIDLNNIPVVLLHLCVTKGHLILERLWSQELHWFQVGVKLVDDSQGDLQHMLNDKAHRHIIRESNLIPDTDELSVACDRDHFLSQRST